MATLIQPWQLRARFAGSLSELYGREVPAYNTLVNAAREVNENVVRTEGLSAERLGSIERVTAERHGAIRLGTPHELRQAARIFGAMGMFPVGFYDLRDARPSPVPVVATAFRPLHEEELARNPFRVFTSLLAVTDRRFFSADLQRRVEAFLERRELLPPELLELAERAERDQGLPRADADRFIALATRSFQLSREPIDGPWYRELERVSAVAADIGGVGSTHINHLTPRVLDIDALYERMQARGITMIDAIQGPPRWEGPDVLLRQTSFRALAEPRRFRRKDGLVEEASLRVRFGEVEARGIALTASGRDAYDELSREVADMQATNPEADGATIASQCWNARMPATERALALADLAFFTYALNEHRRDDGRTPPSDPIALLEGDWITAQPIVYEDFLPRSAAGIFQSNLSQNGSHDDSERGAELHAGWMSDVLGREIRDPIALCAEQRQRSLDTVHRALVIDARRLPRG